MALSHANLGNDLEKTDRLRAAQRSEGKALDGDPVDQAAEAIAAGKIRR
jgi:hypothetical protein